MRMKIVASTLAFLLLVPHLLAGESSPAVKLAVAPKYPTLTLAGRVYGEVTVRVTLDRAGAVKAAKVTEGHPMLREAAVNAARQWRFVESSVDNRVALLKFSFVILPDNSQVQSQTIFLPPAGFEIRQKAAAPAVEDQEGEFSPDPHPVSKT
jgi:TonB family protein